jgi:hypothetical protein
MQQQQEEDPNANEEEGLNPPDVDPEDQDQEVVDDIPFVDPTLMRRAFLR